MVAFDEMTGSGAELRPAYEALDRWLKEAPPEMLALRRSQAELFFRRIGITFAVYGDEESTERLIPFDIIPRVLTKPEWTKLEAGLRQRVTALNMFLADVYGPKECLKAGIIPPDLVYRNACYQLEMVDFKVPHDIYCHIAGIDVVRVDAELMPKPFRSGYDAFLRRFAIDPARAAMFEDLPRNLEVPKELGMRTVLVHEAVASEGVFDWEKAEVPPPYVDFATTDIAGFLTGIAGPR